MIPYGRQSVDDDDIAAVVAVLRGDWLTTGPAVDVFERSFADYVGAQHAVAVATGTAALHAAMRALGVGPGDEVIVPPMTFAATVNAVVYEGATPVFADVDPSTLLLDPESVAERISPRTKAVVGVDYAGQPCDWPKLAALAKPRGIALVADGCHALGAELEGRRVGTLADLTTFSFHPVKHITTGEGGLVTTDDPALAARMRRFRNHGITTDQRQRAAKGTHAYDLVELGFNYRLSDIACALGTSQLRKQPAWLERRRAIADRYDAALQGHDDIAPLARRAGSAHAWHLYVVRVAGGASQRDALFQTLRSEGIGTNVHYLPVHLHPFYRERFGTREGLCPVAEAAYASILSLPMYPAMSDDDVARVIDRVLHHLKG